MAIVSAAVPYPVKLDIYEGPLDLLLQLVSRERVDVAEIPISSVTDEFLRATEELGQVDLETASSFLVLAATLLELKSMKLLPQLNTPDPEIKLLLEERDRLLHRLIQYSSYKRAAGWLNERLLHNSGYHSRSAELPEELIPAAPDIFKNMTVDMLAAAAARSLARSDPAPVDTSHVTSVTVSLEEMVKELSSRIERHGHCYFRQVCLDQDRMRVVVSFLALLELYRTEKVELHQDEPFAGITVMWKQRMAEEVQ